MHSKIQSALMISCLFSFIKFPKTKKYIVTTILVLIQPSWSIAMFIVMLIGDNDPLVPYDGQQRAKFLELGHTRDWWATSSWLGTCTNVLFISYGGLLGW